MSNIRGSEWHKWDLHLHTASSYDSLYKSEDADEILCKKLEEHKVRAVAVTDHFKIDKDRIDHLKKLATDITFFPGVELRTDKGANNLHLIVIFPEDSDLSKLSEAFDVIMLRSKAKEPNKDEKIHWNFDDVIKFAKEHEGLITIHAGKKSNGIDKEISNALPVNEAIKEEIAKDIDFFEVGNKKDIETYYKIVYKEIEEKPIIMCSDCHDPREYEVKENLWIKGELTFAGLKQCLFQPKERVFVGLIPPALDRVNKNKQVNIDTIAVNRTENAANSSTNWFDFTIPLNAGLVAIIGNKGSGKSALSDIIGHLCKSKTMESASFLNDNRFRKGPKNYADDYAGVIKWADDHKDKDILGNREYSSTVEDAQYLPQKYIEEVCNNIENVFQSEINKVIFSYVDKAERGDAKDLDELVTLRSKVFETEVLQIISEIKKINTEIINLENKKTKEYSKKIEDSLKKMKDVLKRHDASKPKIIDKPVPREENAQYSKDLIEINELIKSKKLRIEETKNDVVKLNTSILETQDFISKVKSLQLKYNELKKIEEEFVKTQNLLLNDSELSLVTPKDILEDYLLQLQKEKSERQNQLDDSKNGLNAILSSAEQKKIDLIAHTDLEEKIYQKYLNDKNEWNEDRKKIVGNRDNDKSLKYFENEKKYLENELDSSYEELRKERRNKLKELHSVKKQKVTLYEEIYSPVEGEITNLLGDLEDNISFKAEIQQSDLQFDKKVLKNISQRYAGVFKGTKESQLLMTQILKETDFDDTDSVTNMITKIMQSVDEDIDLSEKKIANKQDLYDYLYSLDYIDVSFKLKMGWRDLSELSPGERGIVLLIFYLALSKNNMPIIIDQPEDNLDNQSVFNKLVPCICRAKQKRQVIIVTHNPNIAVACDAEQIIYCSMDKNKNKIEYISGAIENVEIKQHVIDVLEGTMPAFDLRRQKYD